MPNDNPVLLKGELYTDVRIIFFSVSSLLCLPPPTSPSGKDPPDIVRADASICFQFSGQSHFNQSARGSFGDSLAELDTSVGVSGHYIRLPSWMSNFKEPLLKQNNLLYNYIIHRHIHQHSKATEELFHGQLILGDPCCTGLARNKRQHNHLLHIR